MKTLVTGGVRSGKSRYALALAESLGPRRVYLATGRALDEEMRARIARHRDERGPDWITEEEPLAVAERLEHDAVVVLDCITLWLCNQMMEHGEDADLGPAIEALASAIERAPNPVVVVTNEVGFGIVPEHRLGRLFRDWAGIAAQRLARACDTVVLVCAGLPLAIKGRLPPLDPTPRID